MITADGFLIFKDMFRSDQEQVLVTSKNGYKFAFKNFISKKAIYPTRLFYILKFRFNSIINGYSIIYCMTRTAYNTRHAFKLIYIMSQNTLKTTA
jgi:hypothetical protein